MKIFVFNNKSIATTWLLSYMSILFIPIIISGVMYFQAQKIFQSEIEKSNRYLLNIFKQNMDSTLSAVEKLSMEIATDTNIQNILNLNHELDNNDRYLMIKVSDALKRFKAVNKDIDNIYIYLKSNDLVVSPTFFTDSGSFLNLYGKETGIGQNEFQKSFIEAGRRVFTSTPVRDKNEKEERLIMYTTSLPVFEKSYYRANLVITMNDSVLFNGADSVVSYDHSGILILNDQNGVIASTNLKEPFDLDTFDKLPDMDKPVYYKSAFGNYVVSSIPSDVAKWRCVLIVPAKVFMEKTEYMRKLIILGLVLCCVIGGFITYYSMRKSYNPLKNMIKSLENRLKYSYDQSFNEYGFIQQAINKVADENEKINYKLLQQSKALKSGFIASLLKGKERQVPVHELISNYDLCFESDDFLVIAFYIEKYDSSVFQEMDHFAQYKMIQFILTNVVEELVGQANLGFMTEIDDLSVCLVNVKKDGVDDWKKEMQRVIHESQEFISAHYKISIVAAVSNIHTTVQNIPEAYDEALKTMEYKRVMGIHDIHFFDEIDDLPKTEYYFPLEKEYQLMNCVKSGDFHHAKSLLEEVFQLNFEHGKLSIEIARCLMFDLVSAMIKTINEIGSIYQNDFVERMNPAKSLLECKTVNQMKNQILATLNEVCGYISSVRKNTDYKIRDKAVEFIEKNYMDMNLGISTIADDIGLNPAYVSKLFKEQAGVGILDYINQIRISKAKELMKLSNDNMENIARLVGYSNTKTFTRAFKKHEGTTPGKFKE